MAKSPKKKAGRRAHKKGTSSPRARATQRISQDQPPINRPPAPYLRTKRSATDSGHRAAPIRTTQPLEGFFENRLKQVSRELQHCICTEVAKLKDALISALKPAAPAAQDPRDGLPHPAGHAAPASPLASNTAATEGLPEVPEPTAAITASAPDNYPAPHDAAGGKYPSESLEASKDEALAKILEDFESRDQKPRSPAPKKLLLRMYDHGALPNSGKTFEWSKKNIDMQPRTMWGARDILKSHRLIDTEVSRRTKQLKVPKSKIWNDKAKQESYHSAGQLTERGVRIAEYYLRSLTKKPST